jgi:hypothetical protein
MRIRKTIAATLTAVGIMLAGCANNMSFEQRQALLAMSQGMQTFGNSMRESAARQRAVIYQQPLYRFEQPRPRHYIVTPNPAGLGADVYGY